ncbi:MAG TPA: TRAP transporter small permease [Clostridia bacterium]|nr:TRAP transporter small permease [Clostridia bacterium]
MKMLKRFSKTVNMTVSYIGISLFVVLIVACVAQVFFRFVLNNSLSWTEELARYCFIWMHMIGASLLIESSEHATVTVVMDLLHGAARKVLDVLIELVILLSGAVMLRSGIILAYSSRANLSTAMSIPMWIINSSVAAGGLLLIIQAIVKIVVVIWDTPKKKEGDAQ